MRKLLLTAAGLLGALALVACLLAAAASADGPVLLPVANLPLVVRAEPTPVPTVTPPVTGPVTFSVGSVMIPTYPYSRFLGTAVDSNLANYPVRTLNRNAYDSSVPRPVPVTYTLLALGNRYLRLTLLPELGGRIYEVVFKPTGHDELYRNTVLKPTHWGPSLWDGHPADANWWLAAGGIEWAFPVEEHGYEWATAWNYTQGPLADGGQAITLTLPAAGRPAQAGVTVSLAPERAAFMVQPRITNLLDRSFCFKWWANAMTDPGGANRPGADLRFLFPVSQVVVHSRGDADLPAAGQVMSWPVYGGRDLSRLGTWRQYLGFFESPAAQRDWMGAYDTAAAEGLLRIFPSAVARGAKGFGMGWSQPIGSGEWTDDGSSYVELHGGLARNFADCYTLPARSEITWQETWYPAAGIGQVISATAAGAVSLARTATSLDLGIYLPYALPGATVIVSGGDARVEIPAQDLAPDHPFRQSLSLAAGGLRVTVVVQDRAGNEVYRYAE